MNHDVSRSSGDLKSAGHRLVDLLDYLEQVVRLDERVALRLADYRLPDGTFLAIADHEFAGLPGVLLDRRDEDGAVWLTIERFARHDPPLPPSAFAPWLKPSSDPLTDPGLVAERLSIVSATERAALLACDHAAEEDFRPVPERPEEPGAEPRFHLTLRLADTPALAADIEDWIDGPWRDWAETEAPRRRTIGIYGRLYKLRQQLELGGQESAVEAVWGIGPVRWLKQGRILDRPFIERQVELDLDAAGTLRVRPRPADARVDLKPYEDFGCPALNQLEQVIEAGIAKAGEDDGVVPFRPETFEPILTAAATRIDSGGFYAAVPPPGVTDVEGPVIGGGWVLFARPRSRHVVLDDIARYRTLAAQDAPVEGLAARLVTAPEDHVEGSWAPLGATLGMSQDGNPAPADDEAVTDVFFPKPFNDDQITVVRRLAGSEGLVVQGPPGTGKTHTIANLICHAMALGQRVLVVSRGEAALSVLREQLPEKVRPLAIALLASERQGMRQVETAIREIQSIVEESRPEIRLSAIRRCEAEIVKIRDRTAAIDIELDTIAERQREPIGPAAETPGDIARRLRTTREDHAWFVDRPAAFAAECGLTDEDISALAEARRAAGDLLDHIDAVLPPRDAVPDARTVAGWHDDLIEAGWMEADNREGPLSGLRLPPERIAEAMAGIEALRSLAAARESGSTPLWLDPVLLDAARQQASPWLDVLREIASISVAVEAERARLVSFAIEIPAAFFADAAARAAVSRVAAGERPWGMLALGQSASKELVAAIRVRGSPPGEIAAAWRAVERQIVLQDHRLALDARWRVFAAEAGGAPDAERSSPAAAAAMLARIDACRSAFAALADIMDRPALDGLLRDPAAARALASRLETAAIAARLASAEDARRAAAEAFEDPGRTAAMARQCLLHIVGRAGVETARVEALWSGILDRLDDLHRRAPAFAVIREICGRIAEAGAPLWAERLRTEPAQGDADPLLRADWRLAWDQGAADRRLAEIDGRSAMMALSREREALDRRGRKLFVELVRERAFHTLERRLSPRVKSALVEYVRALGRLGKGTGKGAGHHRRAARAALARCYEAIPCWIMPTWRVAELLPSGLATFDLVILDEASQSDVTELPALLRGRKILAVGDDRQVSPTPPFVSLAKIEQLRQRYLKALPFGSLLEPGESLYDLMRAVYPDSRLMLKEHFRCVEPIIRFSMQFYPERLVPLRLPAAYERLDPPLVDIFVPHGLRDGVRKINRAEAEVIVDEIAAVAADPAQQRRSIGVISLIGGEQAELIHVMLSERIGDEAMQRHAVLCGDSAKFQGNERDIVFLSMVADRRRRSSLTMLRYEQRFNVAASRARDRLVLVRSVEPEDLNPKDLKARLIAHFKDPMPAHLTRTDDLEAACESDFERDVLKALLERGYRVEPQVGAEGFRIDFVVEGMEGRRLAVECDGDSFHGPAQWREDMRRQRILERVGWRFWRCFASTFYHDPEGSLADLLMTLHRQGIAPLRSKGQPAGRALSEHRVVAPPPALPQPAGAAAGGIEAGDQVALVFGDRRRLIVYVAKDEDDPSRGIVGAASPLGRNLLGAEEGDEIEVPQLSGLSASAVIESVSRPV